MPNLQFSDVLQQWMLKNAKGFPRRASSLQRLSFPCTVEEYLTL